jgi:rubrerythrin
MLLKRSSGFNLVKMMQSWPSQYAKSAKYPLNGEPQNDAVEMFGIRCRNCGFPIVDHRKVSDCPSCETTNFRPGIIK